MTDAVKYHISPKTGNANKCTATKRGCKYGVPEGEHYPTKEEARAAFEKQNGAEALATLRKNDGRGRRQLLNKAATVAPISGRTVTEVKETLAEAGVSEASKVVGRVREVLVEEDGRIEWSEVRERADFLIERLSELDPRDPPGLATDPYPDYKYLGGGLHRNAFLHKPSGLVYKIPHRVMKQERMKKLQTLEQESYGLVDVNSLQEKNITYAKTYFMEGSDGSPLQVQEYVDTSTYCFAQWSMLSEEQSSFLQDANENGEETGLGDFGFKNMLVTEGEGGARKVVLIDCLRVPEEEYMPAGFFN